MKLRELLELCWTYVELDINVRDAKGYLIKQVYIGQDEWRAHDAHYVSEHKEIITALNYYESDEPMKGLPGCGTIFKVIPKDLLNAEVTHYRPSKALPYYTRNSEHDYESHRYNLDDAVTLNADVVMLI